MTNYKFALILKFSRPVSSSSSMSYAFRTCKELIGVLVQTIQKKKICSRIYVINGGAVFLKRFLWYSNHVSALIELLVEVVFVILSKECHRCNGDENDAFENISMINQPCFCTRRAACWSRGSGGTGRQWCAWRRLPVICQIFFDKYRPQHIWILFTSCSI